MKCSNWCRYLDMALQMRKCNNAIIDVYFNEITKIHQIEYRSRVYALSSIYQVLQKKQCVNRTIRPSVWVCTSQSTYFYAFEGPKRQKRLQFFLQSYKIAMETNTGEACNHMICALWSSLKEYQ